MHFRLLFILCCLMVLPETAPSLFAQGKVKSVPFTYLPDKSDDRYNQRLKHKTLPLSETDFAILSKKTDKTFAVERFDGNLNKLWSAPIELKGDETIETFALNNNGLFVLTNRMDYAIGFQQLFAHQIDLRTGQKSAPVKLFEAPVRGRRIGISVSEDGSKIETFQFLGPEDQVKAITATIFDGTFKKIKNQTYNLRDIGSIFSSTLYIDNQGNQYLALLTDQNTKLAVRRYPLEGEEAKVMSVQLGGRFSGRDIYVFDLKYQLEQNGLLAVAAICMDKGTANYHSLKMVKFDFAVGEMRFAPEFLFTPEYLTSLSKYYPAGKPITRLEDIELSQILVTPQKEIIVIAEKKYTEGGEDSPYVAKELHLFAYDEYQNLAWRSILMKDQVAPPEEGFSGISYLAHLQGGDLNIFTLETLNDKTDLYRRSINVKNGAGEGPKPLGLNVANDKSVAYIKDFTAWLNEKTMIVVNRPSKKSATLQLSKITEK